MSKIVVTGYRGWTTLETVSRVLGWQLDICNDERHPLRVGVGDCPTGVDQIVRNWCVIHQVPYTMYVADWDTYGKKAGPIRNKAMIDAESPDHVLAFLHPASKGTMQCARYARSKGIQVKEIWA